jgi:predicted Zn-dependent protease
MKTYRAALAAALVVSGSGIALHGAADGQVLDSLRNRGKQQPQQQGEQQQQQGRIPNLGREESAAIAPLLQAVQAQDWPTANAALPAAQAGARTPPALYLVGQLTLEIGRGTQNRALQAQGVDAMLASGAAPAEVVPNLRAAQAAFAIDANDFARAEPVVAALVEANPNDINRITQLAQIKVRLNKNAEALALYQRVLQLSEAAGTRASEDVYQRTLAIAYQARMQPQAAQLSRTLVTAYPTPANWRSALGVYRELAGPGVQELDVYRLMRAVGALTSEADYVQYAEAAERGTLFGEAKTAYEAGLSSNAIRGAASYARQKVTSLTARITEDRASLPQQRTQALAGSDGARVVSIADAYFGYGQYADAVPLYRTALQKGADANLVNLRLGAALAMAGQRAEAEAALRAVTGPRADLAQFWLLWLSTRT